MDDATPLGERIAYYRRRRGLSQVKLAGLLGRSESWLSQIERGVRSIDRISVLTEVAGALNVPVTELSPDPLVLNEACSIDEAIRFMRSRGVRRAPVVTASGTLAGVISTASMSKPRA